MRRTRYPMGPPSHDVVDRQVAERLLAERDALVTQLQRAQGAFDALRRRLEVREDENAQLRYALESRRHPGDAELRAELGELRAAVDRLQVERDRAVRSADEAVEALTAVQSERDDLRARCDLERAQVAGLQARLEDAEHRAPEDAGRVQRLAADLANLRRRRDQDIQAEVNRVRSRLLAELADIRDSLERALALDTDSDNPWAHGLRGVLAQIDGHLRREGVELVGQVGEMFDPHRHEAVAQVAHPEGRSRVVMQVLRPGLVVTDEDLLVRPATVVVSQ